MSDGIQLTQDADRQQLARVLGLPEDAPVAELRPAAARLLSALKRRRALSSGPDEALDHEIADLERAIARHASAMGPRQAPATTDRRPLLGALFGTVFAVLLWMLWPSGLPGGEQPEAGRPVSGLEARLELTGALAGATLRVLGADRQRVWAEIPAQNAVIELQRGRYALEVSGGDGASLEVVEKRAMGVGNMATVAAKKPHHKRI